MQTIIYNGEEYSLKYSTYTNNDALAVLLEDADGEECGVLTVNLSNSHTLPSDCAYLDENNNPGIGRVLVEAGVARPIGQSAQSGFCHYHVFQFMID